MGPERLGRDAFRLLQQAQIAVRDVPLQLNQLAMDLQTGSIDIGMIDREADRMRDEVRWVGIRLSLAMIAGAVGIGGTILLSPHLDAVVRGVSLSHLLGFGFIIASASLFLGLLMHTLFAARIRPSEWLRSWFAVIRFFLPGKEG